MVKITKVYTKQGDHGDTQLAAGKKISKTALRIEAIGCLDELNAITGFAAASLVDPKLKTLQQQLLQIQNQLFDLGAQLAVLPEDQRMNTPKITETDITQLETEIDNMNSILPALNSFILPGGGESSCRLHLARTVCRRAERIIVKLYHDENLVGIEIKYLNRLSDWFFVAARYAASQLNIQEFLWQPNKRP